MESLLADATMAERLVACVIHVVGAMLTAWGIYRWMKPEESDRYDSWYGVPFLITCVAVLWPISLFVMLVMRSIMSAIDWLERQREKG